MLSLLANGEAFNYLMFAGSVFTLLITFLGIILFRGKLPCDQGRAFAVNGEKSKGKPRGAGIIFIITFALTSLIFVPFASEYLIYIGLVVIAMLTGFFDDASDKPWGELKKGLLDLVISIVLAVTYIYYNGHEIYLPFIQGRIIIPIPLLFILIIILAWASINVTNCTDGVDGLCGSLSIITMISIYFLAKELANDSFFGNMIMFMIFSIIPYLWFNASPSQLLMGDAGSRAIGFFIAIAALKSQNPVMYIFVAFVMIIDGGLGLVKLTVMRVFKVKFMANIRMPIHDHMRKNLKWSDTQTVIRFVIIQIIISALVILLCSSMLK